MGRPGRKEIPRTKGRDQGPEGNPARRFHSLFQYESNKNCCEHEEESIIPPMLLGRAKERNPKQVPETSGHGCENRQDDKDADDVGLRAGH